MENTEAEDNFNAWIDILKKNHPDVKLTKELTDILFDTFVLNWKKNDKYKDYLIVHRKPLFDFNSFVEKQYLDLFEQYDKKLFITYDEKLYNDFPLKNKIDLLVCKNLEEQLTIINSAKMNLFNATAPITMASVLNAPRIGELGKWINTLYGSDHLLYDNVEFFDEFDILTPEPKSLKK